MGTKTYYFCIILLVALVISAFVLLVTYFDIGHFNILYLFFSMTFLVVIQAVLSRKYSGNSIDIKIAGDIHNVVIILAIITVGCLAYFIGSLILVEHDDILSIYRSFLIVVACVINFIVYSKFRDKYI